MEKNIVLIHSALAFFLVLYLLIRLLISLFVLRNKESMSKLKRRLRKTDWAFGGLLAISGLYPLLLLGQFELYHILKLLVLVLFIWLSRYAKSFNFATATLIAILLTVYAGYASFTDQPVFPKKAGTFAQKYPEAKSLSTLEKGELIFTTLCVTCHGTDGKLGRFGAADMSKSASSLNQKIEVIEKGSPLTVMRSFTSELSEKEIEAVGRFVDQLSK